MQLTFGKFKGRKFEDAPKWYQDWLLKQSWFSLSAEKKQPLHQQLNGWDGYGKKGETVYNQIFEQEKKQALKQDCRRGICTCCGGSMYYGL